MQSWLEHRSLQRNRKQGAKADRGLNRDGSVIGLRTDIGKEVKPHRHENQNSNKSDTIESFSKE
jgi:hypothetical protein